ncbi:Glycosyl transferase [Clostridium autoethanogenum DSM 10061]|nr:Glycosyl transferase [Clostridium autoethanogenum DSM 10061]OVY50483.1 Poly-beta-1,6-N-acetyl-D-glucosamine synthase [Clostridium autoethanogenum]
MFYMEMILSKTFKEMIFWMAWIIIPFIMEIVPSIVGFFILIKKKMSLKKECFSGKLPEITVIVPVYNSAQTLESCIKSIYESNYPTGLIDVMLVNNMSSDNSFEIFTKSQKEFEGLSMRYLNAKQGKSKALNMALFNSGGKYIIHIDSDGILETNAIRNMVVRFEENPHIHCMTGAILTDAKYIENTKTPFLKLVRRCEFFEYAQAFLAGRNFESELNSIYTLSGAFSAFRKSTILKTQLYNSETVCEDTQITFQVRHLLKKKVYLCENALFFVEPIDNFNKLYTQRQRWQRGEMEVSHMFLKDKIYSAGGFFSNFMIRILMYDHTFAFPRMIWYFALIFLLFMDYPLYLVLGSVFVIYLLYVLSAFLFYLNVRVYLAEYKDIRKYYSAKVYLIVLMPLFNFMIFWIRFAGIINSIKLESKWKTLNLKEEYRAFCNVSKSDFQRVFKIIDKVRRIVNNP